MQRTEINQNKHAEKPQLRMKSPFLERRKLILEIFFKYASSKLNYSRTIPDLKDGNKTMNLLNRVPCVPYVPAWSTCPRANLQKTC